MWRDKERERVRERKKERQGRWIQVRFQYIFYPTRNKDHMRGGRIDKISVC